MRCPCKGCEPPKRKLYCHSHCKEYKEWVEPLEKAREAERLSKTYTPSDGARKIFWNKLRRK